MDYPSRAFLCFLIILGFFAGSGVALAQSPDITGAPVVPVSPAEDRLYTLARDTMVRTLLCAEGFDNNDDADPVVNERLERCYREVMSDDVRFSFASGDEVVGVEPIIAFFRDVRGPQITRSSVRGDSFRLLEIQRRDPGPGRHRALTGMLRVTFKGIHQATALTATPLTVPGPYPMDFHYVAGAVAKLQCWRGRCKAVEVDIVDAVPFEPRN